MALVTLYNGFDAVKEVPQEEVAFWTDRARGLSTSPNTPVTTLTLPVTSTYTEFTSPTPGLIETTRPDYQTIGEEFPDLDWDDIETATLPPL